MADIFDAVAAIDEHVAEFDLVKLMKLLYLAQGWSLACSGRALFADEAVAWENGPVFPAVRSDLRGGRGRRRDGDASRLDEYEREVVRAVCDRYGNMSKGELVELTHGQAPWREAYRPDVNGRSSGVISKSAMARWFSQPGQVSGVGAVLPPPSADFGSDEQLAQIAEEWADALELLGR